MSELTEPQLRALKWLADIPHQEAHPYGQQHRTFAALEAVGLVEPLGYSLRPPYRLTDRGREVLANAQ